MVELLLKEYHANPNIVNTRNWTTMMQAAMTLDDNLSMMKLLTKYGFDFANLINKRDNFNGDTVFHILCSEEFVDNNIDRIKYLFDICKNIANCSINILAKNDVGMCGLHEAIDETNVELVKYLLQNIYFPNNDKMNKDGVAFMHMPIGSMPLDQFVIMEKGNTKRKLEIFKMLVSYGMIVNSKKYAHIEQTLKFAISKRHTEIVQFLLNENLCSIKIFENIWRLMFHAMPLCSEIVKILYKYGIKNKVICDNLQHFNIIAVSGQHNLDIFKSTMSMVLAHHGIKHLEQYKQCRAITVPALEYIAQIPQIKPDVKSFIEALISNDETKLLKLITTISAKEAVFTCINNHELNSSNNKIINYQQHVQCSFCGDSINNNDTESLTGFQCDECKSYVCNDCVIVQKINQKINGIDENIDASSVKSKAYEESILKEIWQYRRNKKLFTKVKLNIRIAP